MDGWTTIDSKLKKLELSKMLFYCYTLLLPLMISSTVAVLLLASIIYYYYYCYIIIIIVVVTQEIHRYLLLSHISTNDSTKFGGGT